MRIEGMQSVSITPLIVKEKEMELTPDFEVVKEDMVEEEATDTPFESAG